MKGGSGRIARSLSLVAAVASASCANGGGNGEIVLKLGHVGNPGSLYQRVADEFAARVDERLAGRARLEVFGASQLGGDEVMLQKLKLGTLDLALPSTVMSSTIDAFGLFEMPYLVRDREHMKRIEQAVIWPELAPLAAERGYTVLAVWENGFRHMTSSVRAIATPQDLRGIKLRTPRGVWRVKLFQAYGANPTPMPFSEVFIALQTGVMDGQENPLSQIYSAKLHEVQSHLSLTAHVYTPAFVTAGASPWARVPEDVRAAVAEIAREMQDFVYQTAVALDAQILAELRAAGIKVNEADTESFREASGPIYDEFAASVSGGRELIDRALAVTDAASEGDLP